MSSCRTCGASIVWATTEKSGRKVPIDAAPVVGGNVRLREQDGGLVAAYMPPGDEVAFISHFATCPQADQHRRRS